MALVRVKWFEIVTRETEVEVDGYDPKDRLSTADLQAQLGELNDKELEAAIIDRGPRTVENVTVIRNGEPTPEIKPAKQREGMF